MKLKMKCSTCGAEIDEGFMALGHDEGEIYEFPFCSQDECLEEMRQFEGCDLASFKNDFVFVFGYISGQEFFSAFDDEKLKLE